MREGWPSPTLSETGVLPLGLTFKRRHRATERDTGTGHGPCLPVTFAATNAIAPDAAQPFTVSVVKAATTTAVSASPPNPVFGTPVTFTAVVAPTVSNSLTPTGIGQLLPGTLRLQNNTVGNIVASNNSGPGPHPGNVTVVTGNFIKH
jgi:hypothetical protein